MSSESTKFPLLTAEEIEDSPSRRNGISAAKEEQARRTSAIVIYETAQKKPFPDLHSFTAWLAVMLYNRFYTRRSLDKNHRFIVSAACLFLASKANNEPRHLDPLVFEMLKQWYNRENPDMRQKLADESFQRTLLEAVKDAEMVVLYTVGFDFEILANHYLPIREDPNIARLLVAGEPRRFWLAACNDVVRKDARLLLQYPMRTIALAICQAYIRLAKHQGVELPLPEPAPDGTPWSVPVGLPPEELNAIVDRIFKTFAMKLDTFKARKTHTHGAASAAAGSSMDGPHLGSPVERGIVHSTATGPTALARSGDTTTVMPAHTALLSTADKPAALLPSGSGSGGSKRQREGGAEHEEGAQRGGHGDKRAREAAEQRGGPAALPPRQQPQQHRPPQHRPPQHRPLPQQQQPGRSAAPRGAGAALGAGAGVAPPGVPFGRHPPRPAPAPPPAPPPAAEDDELEEGEIEEGEIV